MRWWILLILLLYLPFVLSCGCNDPTNDCACAEPVCKNECLLGQYSCGYILGREPETIYFCVEATCGSSKCVKGGYCSLEPGGNLYWEYYCTDCGIGHYWKPYCSCSDAEEYVFVMPLENKTFGVEGECAGTSYCQYDRAWETSCESLNMWYGVDAVQGEERQVTCGPSLRGDSAYYLAHMARVSGAYAGCRSNDIFYLSSCQERTRYPWNDTINGCSASVRLAAHLRTDYEVYEEGEKIDLGYFGAPSPYRHNYYVDYLGAKTGKADSPRKLQEVKYREDKCFANPFNSILYGYEYADNETIGWGWASKEDASSPDLYPMDGNIPADYLVEWTPVPDLLLRGDYEDFLPYPLLIGFTYCPSLLGSYDRTWSETAEGYRWLDAGCYYSRCTVAFYDPDRPNVAYVVDLGTVTQAIPRPGTRVSPL